MFKNSKNGIYWEASTPEEQVATLETIQATHEKSSIPVDFQNKLSNYLSTVYKDNKIYDQISRIQAADPVDIVIPVYNALHLVKECLRSIEEHTHYPYRVTIVDDASDETTEFWLQQYAEDQADRVTLLRNEKNRGFAGTCNRGILHSSNPYVCLLNSDVIVTPNWLLKLMMAIKDDPRNAIVNPVTNNTAVTNLPMIPGTSYLDMNRGLEAISQCDYPEIMPTGFCFLFPRQLVNEIGYLDEAYGSYGEESDWHMRAISFINRETGKFPQYRAVLADNTYVFHERGSSFSELDESDVASQRFQGSDRFHKLNPVFRESWAPVHNPKIKAAISAISNNLQGYFGNNEKPNYKYNVAWVVSSTSFCGGMKYISDIVNTLIEQNVNVKVVQIGSKSSVLTQLHCAPVRFPDRETFLKEFKDVVFSEGHVVAATAEMGAHVLDLCNASDGKLQAINHVQSWDVAMTDDEATKKKLIDTYHSFDNSIFNSSWVQSRLKLEECSLINPGVDREIFYPKNRAQGDERLTLVVHLSKQYPFKGYERAVAFCNELYKLAKRDCEELRIIGIGVDFCPESPNIICKGVVSQNYLANLLSTEADYLLDPAQLHSYGLPCLEAMACNVMPVCWNNEGVFEYANLDENIPLIFPKDAKPEDAAGIFWNMVNSTVPLAADYYPILRLHERRDGVRLFIQALEDIVLHRTDNLKKIVFVTPHIRKHGGPSTIIDTANVLHDYGHDVQICCVHADSILTKLISSSKVPFIFGKEHIPDCDVIFVPSDSDIHEYVLNNVNAQKKVVFKLSHNERFKVLEEQALTLPYDGIVTSSKWLKEACETPIEGWNHPSVKATRVGWTNYCFPEFNKNPEERIYNRLNQSRVVIGGLVHPHPLKGTAVMADTYRALHAKYGNRLHFTAIGEHHLDTPDWLNYFRKLDRQQLANYFQQIDIWLGCSLTEGLGRMGLEAMSAGAACVLSNTGAEYAVHNKNCLLYPCNDVEGAFLAVESILNDTDLFSKLIVNGYSTAKSTFDQGNYLDNLETFIQGLF